MGAVQVGGGGGGWQKGVGECSVNGGDVEKLLSKDFSKSYLKTMTEGAVTMEVGSLFQYFTTLTENADPLLRRWLAPWSALKGCPLRPRRVGGRKNKFGSVFKRPLNILKAIMRSSRSRRRCKKWRPSRCSLSLYGRWRMPGTNRVAYLWIRSRWLISATRFGEKADIPYSRCGRTKARIKGWKPILTDLVRSALSWRSIV